MKKYGHEKFSIKQLPQADNLIMLSAVEYMVYKKNEHVLFCLMV